MIDYDENTHYIRDVPNGPVRKIDTSEKIKLEMEQVIDPEKEHYIELSRLERWLYLSGSPFRSFRSWWLALSESNKIIIILTIMSIVAAFILEWASD